MYPNCPYIKRTITVGGRTKEELIKELQQHSIFMNEAGETIFTASHFETSDTDCPLTTIELSVSDLGLPDGASTKQLYTRAQELTLHVCPLELGPHLRLQYLDQPEGFLGKPLGQNQAPYGSITIASEISSEDPNAPKGFYLRKINGELWLRGYRADDLHIWKPDDRFIFIKK